MLVELCVQNAEAAAVAEAAGADRIELCSELGLGGITPSAGLIKTVRKRVRLPIHVLLRPRSGDFTYSRQEYETLIEDLNSAREWGVNGFVTGALNPEGKIDTDRMAHIRELTAGLHLTFHRAFDLLPDPIAGIEKLQRLGFDTVLTSGQQKNALKGMSLLSELKETVHEITIMPGGGINPENIDQFRKAGFRAIHFSGTVPLKKKSVYSSEKAFTLADLGSGQQLVIQAERVRRMIRSVK